MLVLVILFALISLFLGHYFIRYHLVVKDVAQQITEWQTGDRIVWLLLLMHPVFRADRGS